MQYYHRIINKVSEYLSPCKLLLTDQSAKHKGHTGAHQEGETHFDILIVSDKFINMNKVSRQRLIYKILSEEITERVHALSMALYTKDEYESIKNS